MSYETDEGKTQENREILEHKLQAGKRSRSLVHRYVYATDADLRVVGYPRILISNLDGLQEVGDYPCQNASRLYCPTVEESSNLIFSLIGAQAYRARHRLLTKR